MVPEEFHDFFLGAAGVAGALIGLLFVAISVVPEGIGEASRAVTRVRPTAALSAFLNALVVSLLALVPGVGFGQAAVIMALVGLGAVVGLLALTLRDGRDGGWLRTVRSLAALVGQGVVYGFQFVAGLEISADPGSVPVLSRYAVLVVILFTVGIDRAWEYVGAATPGLLQTLLGGFRGRDDEAREADSDEAG